MRAIETFPNLVTMFFTRATERGDTPFLWRKSGGTWHPLSWNEVARRVAALLVAAEGGAGYTFAQQPWACTTAGNS